MTELGELLKQARNDKEMSLDDIQDMTKIRKRYLEAIEEGNYKVLPGSFYVRAFVKTYAETVGLDADEVLRLYNKDMPALPAEPVSEPMMKPRRGSARASDRWSKWGFTILMWAFFILIIVVVYVFYIGPDTGKEINPNGNEKVTEGNQGTQPGNNNPGEETPDNTKEEEEVEPPPVEPPVTNETKLNLVDTKGSTDYYEVSPAGKHKYEVKIIGGSSWLEIRRDKRGGDRIEYLTAEDGQVFTHELEGAVYINAARADFVEITIDGVPVDNPKETGKPRRFQFDPAGAVE
ncbi:helix-turn-helix domain-containing protein [Paenibacillaceae bacterium]|nr:helix-turn-helix domain-containing protein [Paenibacillaceae bacterium]